MNIIYFCAVNYTEMGACQAMAAAAAVCVEVPYRRSPLREG